jgi:hypothetical protein
VGLKKMTNSDERRRETAGPRLHSNSLPQLRFTGGLVRSRGVNQKTRPDVEVLRELPVAPDPQVLNSPVLKEVGVENEPVSRRNDRRRFEREFQEKKVVNRIQSARRAGFVAGNNLVAVMKSILARAEAGDAHFPLMAVLLVARDNGDEVLRRVISETIPQVLCSECNAAQAFRRDRLIIAVGLKLEGRFKERLMVDLLGGHGDEAFEEFLVEDLRSYLRKGGKIFGSWGYLNPVDNTLVATIQLSQQRRPIASAVSQRVSFNWL